MKENEIAILKPIGTPEQAQEAMALYQATCLALLDSNDVQEIQGKEFKKKSAWRKLAKAFNLSTEIVEERSEKINFNGVDVLAFHFRARATAPNGAFAEGTGSCDTSEKGMQKTIHNTRTIAETRAVNRAISSLIGSGEVSADEIQGEDNAEKPSDQNAKSRVEVLGICGLCGSNLLKSKFNNGTEYYCEGYKDKGCKNKGLISALKAKTGLEMMKDEAKK